MSTLSTPVDIEISDISSILNSAILFIFSMGIYTVIYFGTIYIYFTKKLSKHSPVPAAITVLYLSSITQAAVQWYSLKWQFVDNGGTRDSIFSAILVVAQWTQIVSNVSNCVVFGIADGLLIWRCFYVWNRSLWIIAVSSVLFTAEIALFLAQIAFQAKYGNSIIPTALAARLNALFAAAFFMSFGTTLVTTVLIAHRIHSVSKHRGTSSRRFKYIIDIVVQSGAVYALAQLAAAVAVVVPGSATIDKANFAVQFYTQQLSFSIAGISSTIMVTRVALLSADTTYSSTSVHLSGLQFRTHANHPTVNEETAEITQSGDVDRVSAGKEQVVQEKV